MLKTTFGTTLILNGLGKYIINVCHHSITNGTVSEQKLRSVTRRLATTTDRSGVSKVKWYFISLQENIRCGHKKIWSLRPRHYNLKAWYTL